MQVHRSKGVTTLKLTKREQDTINAAFEILSFVGGLQGLAAHHATEAAESIAEFSKALAEKETVET